MKYDLVIKKHDDQYVLLIYNLDKDYGSAIEISKNQFIKLRTEGIKEIKHKKINNHVNN